MFIFLVFLTLLSPILSIVANIFYFLQFKKPVKSAFIFGLAFAVILYYYVPDSGNDSVRHMENLALYNNISFLKCFDAGVYERMYTWDVWNWIVVQFDDPFLLPASGAFVGFGILSYIILDYCKVINASRHTTIWIMAIVFLISSPMSYAIGIRNGCSVIICTLAYYLSEVKRNKKYYSLVLLIIAVLLHHSSILIFTIWIVLPVIKRKPFVSTCIIGLGLLSISIIVEYILPRLSDGVIGSILRSAIGSLESYQENSSYNVANSQSLNARVNLYCSFLLMLMLFLRSYIGIKNNKDYTFFMLFGQKQIRDILIIIIVYMVITLAMMSVMVLNGGRFMDTGMNLSLITLTYSFQNVPFGIASKKKSQNIILDMSIIALCLLTFALHCYSLSWGDASIKASFLGSFSGVIYTYLR